MNGFMICFGIIGIIVCLFAIVVLAIYAGSFIVVAVKAFKESCKKNTEVYKEHIGLLADARRARLERKRAQITERKDKALDKKLERKQKQILLEEKKADMKDKVKEAKYQKEMAKLERKDKIVETTVKETNTAVEDTKPVVEDKPVEKVEPQPNQTPVVEKTLEDVANETVIVKPAENTETVENTVEQQPIEQMSMFVEDKPVENTDKPLLVD